MSGFHLLLALFLLVPIAEIYVLLQVGSVIGALPTIALVVFTAFLGAILMRVQGLATLMRAQSELNSGQLPALALLEGVVILFAGALLLTPGFVTDTAGFACLVPPWRRYFINHLLSRWAVRYARQRPGASGRVIDADYTRDD